MHDSAAKQRRVVKTKEGSERKGLIFINGTELPADPPALSTLRKDKRVPRTSADIRASIGAKKRVCQAGTGVYLRGDRRSQASAASGHTRVNHRDRLAITRSPVFVSAGRRDATQRSARVPRARGHERRASPTHLPWVGKRASRIWPTTWRPASSVPILTCPARVPPCNSR